MARIEPMYKQIVANHQQNKKLTTLRDFLLPLLMNGQVTVARDFLDSLHGIEKKVKSAGRRKRSISNGDENEK
jgi:hypothetical protein